MSQFTFEQGQQIFDNTGHNPCAHIFNVTSVDDKGRAIFLSQGKDNLGLSDSLNRAVRITGARSARAANESGTIIALDHHTRHQTSPYYDCGKDYE